MLMGYNVLKQWQSMSPEQHKEGMKEWMVWAKKCGSSLVDMGAPLGNGQRVTKSNSLPSNKEVVGYSILQADNINEAKKLLTEHPHLKAANSCEIEVHECMPMK
jgi:hypothetical protein